MSAAVIETERLVLRPWVETDRAAWMAMMADPQVAYWLGGALTAQAASAAFDRAAAYVRDNGFGLWAVERRGDRAVIGAAGLLRIASDSALPPACGELERDAGGLEIGWRLRSDAWGAGYASEAAEAALAWGFAHLDALEIIGFTAAGNTRSEAVMRRIGMKRDPARDFPHPGLAEGHPLRPHIVYAAARPS